MVTIHEIDMLAGIISQRAALTEIETLWVADVLTRIRVQVAEVEAEKLKEKKE